jgi:Flp pilus assembly protein TadG
MKRRARRGQATVEFTIVISVFLFLVFGTIEVSRAIFEKQTLARAAEVIAQELADTNPRNVTSGTDPCSGTTVSNYIIGMADVQKAIADANRQSNLNLSTIWPTSPYTDVAHLPGGCFASSLESFDATTNLCDTPLSGTADECQAAPNQDGSVVVEGIPDLIGPGTITVTVSQPYSSFIVFPLQFLGGRVSETVSATTLSGQQGQ